MRFFSHTIAEYVCAKHCGYNRSVIGANFSWFHRIAAAIATIPLWIASFFGPLHLPWYYLFSIFAGELLLVYASGFICSFLSAPFNGAGHCKKCRAPMVLCGRHFDPLGSKNSHWTDKIIFIVFLA